MDQIPVTCERCNVVVSTITGEGTSFWSIVWQTFTIHSVLAVFLSGISTCIKTYVLSNSELISDGSGKSKRSTCNSYAHILHSLDGQKRGKSLVRFNASLQILKKIVSGVKET